MMRKITLLLLALLIVSLTPLYGGISVRLGLLMPQGDYKDYASNAWTAEIVADVSPFSVPYLSVPVMVNYAGFGEQQSDWISVPETGPTTFTQTSSVNVTGGGIGLKLEPAIPGIKPFVEVFGRLASIEQDYHSGAVADANTIESKTKFGYQIDGGLKYSLVPTADLILGASYITFLKASLFSGNERGEVDAKMFGVFTGISFSIGW